jgi:hypothetical protein
LRDDPLIAYAERMRTFGFEGVEVISDIFFDSPKENELINDFLSVL